MNLDKIQYQCDFGYGSGILWIELGLGNILCLKYTQIDLIRNLNLPNGSSIKLIMNFQKLVKMLVAFGYHANLRKRRPNVICMNFKGESKNMRLM